jgi:ethanolamine ammonia-lyase large subunit
MYRATIGGERHVFPDLVTLLAKASSLRSGDVLAGIAAQSGEERVAAQCALADLPLALFSRSRPFRSRPTRSPGGSSTPTMPPPWRWSRI